MNDRLPFTTYHLLELFNSYEAAGYPPIDLAVARYFREHTSLGASDRRKISEDFFGIIRWAGALEALSRGSGWLAMMEVWQDPSWQRELCHLAAHLQVAFPESLYERIISQYGKEQGEFLCKSCNEEAPSFLRVNVLKCSVERLLQLWEGRFEMERCQQAPYGLRLKKREPLFATKEFKEGFFEVQDEGSQIIASKIEAKPGQLVLDYCAGSGGKALAIAPSMRGKGQLFLHDVRLSALHQAKKRLYRAGVQNAQTIVEGKRQLTKLKKRCDWVLVDAPCSGTGTLRRHPDQKWHYSEEMLSRLLAEQRVIFERALSYLKPQGGKIVYATCSILEAENERQVAHFIKTYGLREVEKPFFSLPRHGGMDGFFAATLSLD